MLQISQTVAIICMVSTLLKLFERSALGSILLRCTSIFELRVLSCMIVWLASQILIKVSYWNACISLYPVGIYMFKVNNRIVSVQSWFFVRNSCYSCSNVIVTLFYSGRSLHRYGYSYSIIVCLLYDHNSIFSCEMFIVLVDLLCFTFNRCF